jgi:tetratricopeptide (TPR) repeat protein
LAAYLAFAPSPVAGQSDELARHANKANAALQANDATTARLELQEILKSDPGNVNARANLGVIEYLAGNYADAAGDFESALSMSSSPWSARAFLGLCKARLGAADEARKLLEQSLPHITDRALHLQSSLELVRLYSESGSLADAEPVLKELQASDPANPEMLYASYRLHSELASAALRKLSATGPDTPWLHEVLGQNYLALEQYDPAIEEFRKAVSSGPRITGLHYQLGEALFAAARTETNRTLAEKEFEAELQLNPGDSGSLEKLGEIALERQDYNQAKLLLNRALSERPSFAEAHAALAKILEHEGDAKDAIAELEASARLAPEERTTHYRLAQLYRMQRRVADADRELSLFQTLSAAEAAHRSLSEIKSSPSQ